jgi:hypothetical protein
VITSNNESHAPNKSLSDCGLEDGNMAVAAGTVTVSVEVTELAPGVSDA